MEAEKPPREPDVTIEPDPFTARFETSAPPRGRDQPPTGISRR